MKELIGENFEEVVDDIIRIIAEEANTDEEVIVKDSENSGYDKIAYANNADSTQYLFKLNEDGIIEDVWEA